MVGIYKVVQPSRLNHAFHASFASILSAVPATPRIMPQYTAAEMATPTNHARSYIRLNTECTGGMTRTFARNPGIVGSTPATSAHSAAGFQPPCKLGQKTVQMQVKAEEITYREVEDPPHFGAAR